jgi:hypothetical protein
MVSLSVVPWQAGLSKYLMKAALIVLLYSYSEYEKSNQALFYCLMLKIQKLIEKNDISNYQNGLSVRGKSNPDEIGRNFEYCEFRL